MDFALGIMATLVPVVAAIGVITLVRCARPNCLSEERG